jgi:hypothetical protein
MHACVYMYYMYVCIYVYIELAEEPGTVVVAEVGRGERGDENIHTHTHTHIHTRNLGEL